MDQPGRKSGDALAVVAVLPGERPAPPSTLTEREAELWREIVSSLPADWFSAGSLPLLAEYVRSAAFGEALALELGRYKGIPKGKAFVRYEKIRRTQAQNAARIQALARSMRLSQQSKYGARGADSAARRGTGTGRKPWEFGG